jgi:hypothetical protein
MRFMLLLQLSTDTPVDRARDRADAVRVERYNLALTRAGVLLAGDGLHPEADCVRLEPAGGRRRVMDGADAGRRLVGGYWLLQVSSREEAVEWARRCPLRDGDVLEVRRIREPADTEPESRDTEPGSRDRRC